MTGQSVSDVDKDFGSYVESKPWTVINLLKKYFQLTFELHFDHKKRRAQPLNCF